jgi:predicted MPP superfamily phosphohydrolase
MMRTRSDPVKRLSSLIFRNFWTTIALGGAVGEWALACSLLGVPASWTVHVVALAGLTLVNRLAARAYERERHAGPLRHAIGGVVLAGCIVAAVGAAALGLAAAGWLAVGTLTAFPAQAGALDAPPRLWFGAPFGAMAGVIAALAMAVATWGYTHGHRRLRVTYLDLPLADLPAGLDGLRIVHITDLHLGPTAHRDALREALDCVNALDPDLVCVTGDIVDSKVTDLDHWLPELARLDARHGVFAVLGNHDGFAGADRVAAALRAHTRWRVLRDEVIPLDVDGDRLHLVGLDDRRAPATAAQLPELLAAVPRGEACVLLVHQPSAFPVAARLRVPLTLAGHTHGGQIALPGLAAINPARLLMTRFDAGTFASGDAVLHVNLGLGTTGQRVRIGAPREITVVTLVAPLAAAA